MHSSNLAELLVEFSAGVPQQERNRLLADRGELHLLLFSGPGGGLDFLILKRTLF